MEGNNKDEELEEITSTSECFKEEEERHPHSHPKENVVEPFKIKPEKELMLNVEISSGNITAHIKKDLFSIP